MYVPKEYCLELETPNEEIIINGEVRKNQKPVDYMLPIGNNPPRKTTRTTKKTKCEMNFHDKKTGVITSTVTEKVRRVRNSINYN